MIKSMTAYGRGEHLEGSTRYVAELRSLNNRYRDIIVRIPRNYQMFEEDLRSAVAAGVLRGRVEVTLQKESGGDEAPCELEVNAPMVKAYLGVFERLSQLSGLPSGLTVDSLSRMNDVIVIKPREEDLDLVKAGFLSAVTEALESLDAMRRTEGSAIEADFTGRLEQIGQYVGEVKERVPQVLAAFRGRLQEKLDRLLEDVTVDESRLAQEVAFLAERSDITEELVRLDSHMAQFRDFLDGEGAVGRRLDFLIQEMNREVNTLGAKASDPFISRIVVEMKAELEKLREQVQNVE